MEELTNHKTHPKTAMVELSANINDIKMSNGKYQRKAKNCKKKKKNLYKK